MPPPLRRIPLLPLAGLGIVLFAGLAAFLLSRSVVASNAWVNHTMHVQLSIGELSEQMARQESAFRGYVIRGDKDLMGDFEAADSHVAIALGYLQGITADNHEQSQRLREIERLIGQRIRFMRLFIAERNRIGGMPAPSPDEARYGRPLGIRIRAALAGMSVQEQGVLVRREAHTQRMIDALSIFLAAAVLLVVLVAYTTVGDARARFRSMTEAHREARAAALAQQAEMRAREEAETQLHQVQRVESMGQLTGGIAHDFNNMLAVVIGSLDMAQRHHSDGARVMRYIANARDGAERAATLVARLLAFSRRQPLLPTIVDPNAMVTGMIDLLARTLGEQVEIVTELAPDVWPISADAGQLENALLNLAVNARDAMEQGGTLTIGTANRVIDAAALRRHPNMPTGDYAVFSVADRGAGMSEEVRARAFDPFFTTKPIGKGTGLGLSQVFGFVKQSGGHVAIEPREGGGTIVHFCLPRATPHAAGVQGPAEAAARSGSGQRILVVEDDERVRSFSVEALRELGYVPLAAENGAAALDILRREPDPDLLFTDVVMPGLSGPELVSIVRAARPRLPVLFTTGYARDQLAANADQLDPAIGVLPKPFTVAQLASRVRDALAAA